MEPKVDASRFGIDKRTAIIEWFNIDDRFQLHEVRRHVQRVHSVANVEILNRHRPACGHHRCSFGDTTARQFDCMLICLHTGHPLTH
jgi:hypothetical protein